MGINKNNLENLIMRPTLQEMGDKFYSEAAIQLLLMTCAAESKMGTYLKQGLHTMDDGQARARGIYQMEPATHDDVLNRFNWLSTKIPYCGIANFETVRLIYDLKYATIMARAKYYLVPDALPEPNNIEELAHYYAKWWYGGEHYEDRKQKAIRAYEEYCL